MGRIVISENVTLDGVLQDPNGDEGSARGGWFARISDADRQAWAQLMLSEALGTQALLFGRRSFEYFADRWAGRGGELGDRMRSLPKYVVSSTPIEPDAWGKTTRLIGDPASAVTALKQQVNGEIVVYASGRLVHTLIEHDLADELRLTVHPFVLGTGHRLFEETSDIKALRLTAARTLGDGLAFLTYNRDRHNPCD